MKFRLFLIDCLWLVALASPFLVYEAGLRSWCFYRHARIRAAGGSVRVLRRDVGILFPNGGEVLFRDPRVGGFSVYLGRANVNDANIAMLDCYPGFYTLDLSYTKVTSAGLDSLPNLRAYTLRLRGVRLGDTKGRFLEEPLDRPMLAELDLAYTGVTDRIGPNIARLSGLDTLDLSGTDVTDAIIPYIEKLPGLRFVTLSRTKVTPSGVGALRRAKRSLVICYRGQ